jgi:hypothetical protein
VVRARRKIMLAQRRKAGQDIATCLMAAEAAIDQALASAATLAAMMPTARLEAGVAAEVGQEAMEFAAKTCAALFEARASVVSTHKELAKTRDAVGLRSINFGGLMPKAADLSGAERMHLKSVA